MAEHRSVIREGNDPHCVSSKVAESWLKGAGWKRFVVLGDNSTKRHAEHVAGYRNRAWAHRTADELRRQQPGLTYVNNGKRDLLTAEVRGQQLENALTFEPDLAAIMCCGSEMFRQSFDVDAIETELMRIILALHSPRCDVITVGLFDFTHSRLIPDELKDALRRRLKLLSERANAVAQRLGTHYVDLMSHPAAADGSIFNSDSRLLNSRGHAIAATETLRCLAIHLGNLDK